MRRCLASFMNFIKEGWRSLFQSGNYAACDGMRALSMIWVCSYHAMPLPNYLRTKLEDIPWSVSVPMNGDVGVDIFLMLSGFLLGGALYEEYQRDGSIKIGSFYVKRWFRIAPAYISTLIVTILSESPEYSSWCLQNSWKNLLFINNEVGGCLEHTWTIAVEFQLYAVTPLIFATAWFLSNKWQPSFGATAFTLCSALWCTCCIFRICDAVQHDLGSKEPYSSTVYRMAPYAAGLCGGIAVKEVTKGRWSLGSGAFQFILMGLCGLTLVLAALVAGKPNLLVSLVGGKPKLGGLADAKMTVQSLLAQLPQGSRNVWIAVFLLRGALLRPAVGLSGSFLLVACCTGRAPKLQAFLAAKIWTPVAALSYSMYLLQYSGSFILMLPIYENVLEKRLGSMAAVLAAAYAMPLLAMLGTLPLALLNFLFVERSGIFLSKRVLLAMKDGQIAGTRGKTKKTTAKIAEPLPEVAADLESVSTIPTDTPSETISLESVATPLEV